MTLHDSVRTLEARLLAAPDDAEAWRVYADLLQQLGDVRGELILLEQETERRQDPRLLGRVNDLVEEHRQFWQPKYTLTTGRFEWRHHFVWGLTLSSLVGAWTLAAAAPLFDDPQARLLCELRVRAARHGEFGRDGVELGEALASLALGRLRLLQVAYHPHGDAVVDALVGAPTLALHILDLRYAGIDDASAQRLAACERLAGLRRLYLQGNAIGPAGVEALVGSPLASELELLDLRHNALGLRGARALADAPKLAKLRALHVHVEDISQDGPRALAGSTTLNRELVRYWKGVEEMQWR